MEELKDLSVFQNINRISYRRIRFEVIRLEYRFIESVLFNKIYHT